jgi:hypothetical protein
MLNVFSSNGQWLLVNSQWRGYARHHYSGMYQVQESQLFDYEEQEDYDRTAGNEKILQYLPGSYGT